MSLIPRRTLRNSFVAFQAQVADKDVLGSNGFMSGDWVTNEGAPGIVTLTLPPDGAGAGLPDDFHMTFVRIANFALRIAPNVSQTILIPGGNQVPNKYVQLDQVGSCITIRRLNSTQFAVLAVLGTFSEEA